MRTISYSSIENDEELAQQRQKEIDWDTKNTFRKFVGKPGNADILNFFLLCMNINGKVICCKWV